MLDCALLYNICSVVCCSSSSCLPPNGQQPASSVSRVIRQTIRVISIEPNGKMRYFTRTAVSFPIRMDHEPALTVMRSIRIDSHLAGKRIDKVAAVLLPQFSRPQLALWVKDGSLRRDGNVVPAKHRVFGGEELKLEATQRPPARWDAPQYVGVRVAFQDEHLLVVEKPAG